MISKRCTFHDGDVWSAPCKVNVQSRTGWSLCRPHYKLKHGLGRPIGSRVRAVHVNIKGKRTAPPSKPKKSKSREA